MSTDSTLYNQVFENIYRSIAERRRDPSFTIRELREMLESQYVYQGNDWVGRGTVSSIKTEAVIAAYEHALAEWEREEMK